MLCVGISDYTLPESTRYNPILEAPQHSSNIKDFLFTLWEGLQEPFTEPCYLNSSREYFMIARRQAVEPL